MFERAMGSVIRGLPASWGYRMVKRLASRAAGRATAPQELDASRLAERQGIGSSERIPALSWGAGPVVALVHGWGGDALQMAPLAMRLARAGFRTVAFDVSGHGRSPAREARWDRFIAEIDEVARYLGPLHGYVGHSAGALAMMAARHLRGLHAERFVCISAPAYPYPPLRVIDRRLDPGPAVLARYRDFLAGQFETDWARLASGSLWDGVGERLLICCDDDDRYIDPRDGATIHMRCPGSELYRTRGYGHSRLLGADEVATTIARFLQRQSAATAK